MDSYIIGKREFEWKFQNFTLERIKIDKTILLDTFSIFLGYDETKWRFSANILDGNLGLYLHFTGSEVDDFTVTCNLFIRKPNDEKCNEVYNVRTSNEYKLNKSYGWKNFITSDQLDKSGHLFIKDTVLIVGLKVELTKKKERPTQHQSTNEYQRMCIDYFETKSYSDLELICSDGVKIPAHRFVLAGFSSVMKDIFDTKSSKSNIINIKDIDGAAMTEILRYIYTKNVQNMKELAPKILYGADKYELDDLKKLCVASMIENLSVNNALDYFELGDQYDIKVLLEKSAMFIKSHHEEISQNDKNWKKLPKKYLFLLLHYYHQNSNDVKIFKSIL